MSSQRNRSSGHTNHAVYGFSKEDFALCILQDLFVKKDHNSLEVDKQWWGLQAVDFAALH